MIIAILGSGGREHALCNKISKSTKAKKIFCIPGNAGTSKIATNIDINLDNFDELKKMKPKARKVMMNKLTKFTDDADSEEYQKHEDEVNNEARRLGFEKEIEELESAGPPS